MRKVLALLLSGLMAIGLSLPVVAADCQENAFAQLHAADESIGNTVTWEQYGKQTKLISPKFKYIVSIIHGIDIDSNGYSLSNASCVLYYSSYEAKLTIRIQKWNGQSYVNTYGPWSDRDYGTAFVSKNYKLPSGIYRLQTVCEVYNTAGTRVESVTAYSNIASC